MLKKSPLRVPAMLVAALFLFCNAVAVLAQGSGGSGSLTRESGASSIAKDVAGAATPGTGYPPHARRPGSQPTTTPPAKPPPPPPPPPGARYFKHQGGTLFYVAKNTE